MDEKLMNELLAKSPNRRSFVRKLSMASAAIAAAGALPKTADAQTIGDANILNFALNLEYLEAEFYSYAVTGAGIAAQGVIVNSTSPSISTGPINAPTTGGAMVSFTDSFTQGIATELMYDELVHVTLLQSALTAAGVPFISKPTINLNALGIGFGSQAQFLTLSRIFEDIGVTAYGGAAPLLATPAVLGVAARILATEAEHVGAIRLLMAQQGVAISALDAADILPPPSGALYFSNNSTGLTSVRTPGQVLFLAYGGTANAKNGGFFPNGANGFYYTAGASGGSLDGNTLTINPNPISVAGSSNGLGQATLVWRTTGVQYIEIRIGSPTGPVFTINTPNGSMQTGQWISNGMKFYMLNASPGFTPNNLGAVLAEAIAVTYNY